MKISCCVDANCNDCVKPKTAVSGDQPPFSYVLNTGIKTALATYQVIHALCTRYACNVNAFVLCRLLVPINEFKLETYFFHRNKEIPKNL